MILNHCDIVCSVWIFAPKMSKIYFRKSEKIFSYEGSCSQYCKMRPFERFWTTVILFAMFEFSRQKWTKCPFKNRNMYFFKCDILSNFQTLCAVRKKGLMNCLTLLPRQISFITYLFYQQSKKEGNETPIMYKVYLAWRNQMQDVLITYIANISDWSSPDYCLKLKITQNVAFEFF